VADPSRPVRTSSTARLPSLSEGGVDPLGELEDEQGGEAPPRGWHERPAPAPQDAAETALPTFALWRS
jgi:hypothetical protein